VISKVITTSNGKPVGEAPLVAQADVERAGSCCAHGST
jgi:serine-type D-Ala-D-Ala carboxypeptidase (penicillin-binding protein 5/6)